jgi:glycosyltransferase involved in cell wall biosynthesis
MRVTVAICTYNGAERVPEVLDHLRNQEGVDDLAWEVIVVDNNSTDATEDVVRQYQNTSFDDVPLRYVFEGRQGKSNALQRAVEEARGELIAFLDDDNLPNPQWVSSASEFADNHPRAGAFGGQIHGHFDVELPNSFGLVRPLFALNERKDEVCYSAGGSLEFAAPGAGLVVRRAAWLESVPRRGLDLMGPTGEARGTLGEEFELQWRMYQKGWQIWHNPDMHLTHKIPGSRLEEDYLKGFFKAIGLSRHHTRMMQFKTWQRPFATVGYLLADLLKIFRLSWIYRTKVFKDQFVRGRIVMTFYMLVAPFKSS